MSFTEFCCRSGGNNRNAGTTFGTTTEPSTSPVVEYLNGGWDNTTKVFTPASGNPVTDGVQVGHFVSICTTGSSSWTAIAVVTNVTSTTITVSSTNFLGTFPGTFASNRDLLVGGAWAGPDVGSSTPFGKTLTGIVNSNGDKLVRVNFKNDTEYTRGSTSTHNQSGPTIFEGYSSSYGDEGRVVFKSSGVASAYIALTVSGQHNIFKNFNFRNDINNGTGGLVSVSANNNSFFACSFSNSRGSTVVASVTSCSFIECEFLNNQLTVANSAAIFLGASSSNNIIRCSFFGNKKGSTGNACLYMSGSNSHLVFDCIFSENDIPAIRAPTSVIPFVICNCDFYKNNDHAITVDTASNCLAFISSSNFVANSGYAISHNVSTNFVGSNILDCAFGSGSMRNKSGELNNVHGYGANTFNFYPDGQTPWEDPNNGNFTLVDNDYVGEGRSSFLYTTTEYSGTESTNDIGAAKYIATGGAGSVRRIGWSGGFNG